VSTRPCKLCNRDLIFAVNRATGKTIPLDAKAHVYRVVESDAIRAEDYYVSHFFTCPEANQFSGSRKKGAQEA
jgi:hypothetical protein